jgi:hypothetical protein
MFYSTSGIVYYALQAGERIHCSFSGRSIYMYYKTLEGMELADTKKIQTPAAIYSFNHPSIHRRIQEFLKGGGGFQQLIL